MTALAGGLSLREARSTDAPAMAKLMVRGNSTYREWAPRFWQPPGLERTQSQWTMRLRENERWTRVAIAADGEMVALCSWRPARDYGEEGPPVPGVSYVSHLYVDLPLWGNGIASGILELAEKAMREDGYVRSILWTPTDAPARGFYERCGWRLDGRERWSGELQLPMVGYEKPL
jgi:GNAT superfamily N-acetyltransferase